MNEKNTTGTKATEKLLHYIADRVLKVKLIQTSIPFESLRQIHLKNCFIRLYTCHTVCLLCMHAAYIYRTI